MNHLWLRISQRDVEIERLQSRQEGRETAHLEEEFDRVLVLDLNSSDGRAAAEAVFDAVQRSPISTDYRYKEPDGLEEIRLLRDGAERTTGMVDRLDDRVLGAWLGRCAGCLLGKPVEGWQRSAIRGYLQDSGQWPLREYVSGRSDGQTGVLEGSSGAWFREDVKCMPEDDDLNYTIVGLAVLESAGVDFETENVANFWLDNLPILRTCTAERVAYRNLCNGIRAPFTASFRNPYREWIGAQIRADAWAYAAAGNPSLAAEFAWRDARLSHVKNGIYGEMWAAAMISSAFCYDDPADAIRCGMSEIPETSRIYEALQRQLDNRRRLSSAESAIEAIHFNWDERNPHDWCHVVSNAEVVAMALLWGNRDFETSISLAVCAGFDTDCNGATVGSTLGAMMGASRLDSKWTRPLGDTIQAGVLGFENAQISSLAGRTAAVAERIRSSGLNVGK